MDELGGNMRAETLDIHIADHLVGRIVLDASRKRQFVALEVTGKVEWYRLAGLGVGMLNGRKSEYTGEGSGAIDLAKPAVFAVHVEEFAKDNKALLSLAKESP
jgi:hypothetical protein